MGKKSGTTTTTTKKKTSGPESPARKKASRRGGRRNKRRTHLRRYINKYKKELGITNLLSNDGANTIGDIVDDVEARILKTIIDMNTDALLSDSNPTLKQDKVRNALMILVPYGEHRAELSSLAYEGCISFATTT